MKIKYYYMMETTLTNHILCNNNFDTYKKLIKLNCEKHIEREKETSIKEDNEDYYLDINVEIIDKHTAIFRYHVNLHEILFYNTACMTIEFDEDNEYLLTIPLGQEKIMLILYHFEIA